MMRFLIVCACTWAVISSAAAAIKLDTMRVGDRTYTNVTITSYSTSDVYFSHSKGVASAKLRNVEPSVQKLLDYNPDKAQVAEQAQEQADKRYEGALATTIAARPKTTAPVEIGNFADPISDRSLLGKQAPAIDFEKWLTDRPDTDGKFVLVSFWSTKSAAARKWITVFNGWQKKFKAKLQIVGVTAEAEADVQAFTNPKIEFGSALDSKNKLAGSFGVTTVPSVLLTDPKGLVLYYGHPAALTEAQLQAVLARPVE
jgi:cytochrome c biogenesis protein CcmG, thiol:disulfide interchange protein DsbE